MKMVLSADGTADPDVMAICAASAALQCSPMAWAGPVGAVRAALLPGGELVVSPSVAQQECAALNVLVACTADRVTMMEAEGDEVGRPGRCAARVVGGRLTALPVSKHSTCAASAALCRRRTWQRPQAARPAAAHHRRADPQLHCAPLQVPEPDFLRALRAAVEAAQQLVEPQRQLAQQTG